MIVADTRQAGRRFRRRFPSRLRPLRGRLDPAPLADVVLLVFLFFLVRAPFVVQPAIRLELPPSPLREAANYGPMIVTVTQEGMVFFNDQRTTIEGLRAALERAAYEHPGARLVVEADGRVPHATLVRIYGMAMAAGLDDVALATGMEDEGAAEAGP